MSHSPCPSHRRLASVRPGTAGVGWAPSPCCAPMNATMATTQLARQALRTRPRCCRCARCWKRFERDYQGQALKMEFEQDDGRFIYEIRLLQKDGRMAKLKVDAVDGRVLKIRRKERAGGTGMRILVVEDEPTLLEPPAGARHHGRRPHGGGRQRRRHRRTTWATWRTSTPWCWTWACPRSTACRCCAAGARRGAPCRC